MTENSAHLSYSEGKIEATNNQGRRASLNYFFSEKSNSWYLGGINSDFVGGGKQLIRAFVDTVGKGVPVLASVGEIETHKKLKEAGIFKKVLISKSRKIELSNGDLVESLKLVRMFKGGGLHSVKIVVERVSEDPIPASEFDENNDYPVDVEIFART